MGGSLGYEPSPTASSSSGLYSLFDRKSLVEIRAFADLPDGVKTTEIRDGMEAHGEGPGGRRRQFLVGGVASKSALLVYEQFGYVPTYVAVGYVRNGEEWVSVGKWDIPRVETLKEALAMINAAPK
jgi:hypothetical protein